MAGARRFNDALTRWFPRDADGRVRVDLSGTAPLDFEVMDENVAARGVPRGSDGSVLLSVSGSVPFAGLTSAGKLPVGQAPGPVKLSAALPGLGDQGPLIQGELDALAVSGGELKLPLGLVQASTRTVRAHAGYGSVGALLHIPRNCTLSGGGATEGTKLYCDDRVLGAGDALLHDVDGGGGRLNHSVVRSMTVTTVTAGPSSFSSTAVPPALPWGMLLDRGHLDDIWFEGNLRASIASIGDHNYVHRVSMGGYASVELPSGYKTLGDLNFVECVLQGKFASILLPSATGTNRAIQGWTFLRTHLGSGQAVIYAPASVANQVLVLGTAMISCSFEGMGRGLVYDPNRLGAITTLDIYAARTNTAWFPQPYPTDATVPLGAAIMCGAITGLNVVGGARFFIAPGSDPTSGAIIDATSMQNCQLGDVSVAMTSCEALGVPFAKVTGNVQNVTATRSSSFGVGSMRFAKAVTAVAAGDVLRMVPTANLDSVRRFDSAGALPAGVASMSAPVGGVVPAVFSGPGTPNVARLGRGSLLGSLNLAALPSVSGTSTLSADVSLGSGAVPPRTVESIAVGQTSLKASAGLTRLTAAATLPQATLTVADTTNLLTSGTVQTVAGAVVYTGKTATTLTGCTGGSGAAPSGSAIVSLGDLPASGFVSVGTQVVSYTGLTASATPGLLTFTGIPASGVGSFTAANGASGVAIGRVLQVASNASFSTSNGAVKVGTTYMRYAGKSGTTFLYGVVPSVTAATSASSGDTVTEVNTVTVNGLADGYKTVQGSAVMRSSPFGQILYGAVLPDRLGGAAAAPSLQLAEVTSTQSGSYNAGFLSVVTSGTRLSGAVVAAATSVPVYDTTGFPSSGTILVNGSTVTYTGRNATTFTGCSGVPAAADGSPVTPKPQVVVPAAERYVRPRYATGATDAEDQGLATVAASYVDPLGQPIGVAMGVDDGPLVATRLTLPA